jgi:hypothetical protein
MVELRAQVLTTRFSPLVFIAATRDTSFSLACGPFFSDRDIDAPRVSSRRYFW